MAGEMGPSKDLKMLILGDYEFNCAGPIARIAPNLYESFTIL